MSEELTTIHKDVIIASSAHSGEYHLSAIKKGEGIIKKGSWSMETYLSLVRKLWEDYLNKDIKPQVLEQTLSDEGFVNETRHCIAPNSWYPPSTAGPLSLEKESFAYWLKSQSQKIQTKITPEAFNYLNRELDAIINLNIERKSA